MCEEFNASLNTTNETKQGAKPTDIAISTIEDITKFHADCSMKRVVFADLVALYRCWRSIPSDVLFDAVLIFPNTYTEWIIDPSVHIDIPEQIECILRDQVFANLLQWKYEQGLLFCMLNTIQTVLAWKLPDTNSEVAPFWRHLSVKLSELSDPLTFKTSNYNGIILDADYYTSSEYKPKYNVQPAAIIDELLTMKTQCVDILREILYQCNPSLSVIETYAEHAASGDSTQSSMLSDAAMHGVTDDAHGKEKQSQTSDDTEEEKLDQLERELDDMLSVIRRQWDDSNKELQLQAAALSSLMVFSLESSHGLSDRQLSSRAPNQSHSMLASIASLSPKRSLSTKSKHGHWPSPRDSVLPADGWWVSQEYYIDEPVDLVEDVETQ